MNNGFYEFSRGRQETTSSVFPYTGSAIITGSLEVIGTLLNGLNVTATGDYSHAEGEGSITGTANAYYAQDISSGIITLSDTYGDVTGEFSTDNRLYLYDEPFDNIYERDLFLISQSYFDSTNTIVELYDTDVNTSKAYVGNIDYGVSSWSGDQTIPGTYSHAEGSFTQAIGEFSHAEGGDSVAIGNYSHAEGDNTEAIGRYSHAEGNTTEAIGNNSHAEGSSTKAIGDDSHAEGGATEAIGNYSHAEGGATEAIGDFSHAEGSFTQAIGEFSHAEGLGTITSGDYQHVQGQYNITSSVQSAFIIGNGQGIDNRSNLVFAAGNTVQITGSLNVQGSITGSLEGTASFATSASFATTTPLDATPTSGSTNGVQSGGVFDALVLKSNTTVATTGVDIFFVTPQIYNTSSSPATANITNDLTGANLGIIQKIYHNHSVAPTVPGGWVLIGGEYVVSELNIIYAEWCGSSRVEYWIANEQ